MQPRISILDVAVDDVTEQEAVIAVDGYIRSGEPHQIVTLNPEFIMSAQKNAHIMHVLNHASMSTPDGVGILWAARYLGTPIRERVTGVALVERLARESVQRGWRLFFLGSAPGIAERAAQLLQNRYPGLHVAGTYAGSPRIADEQQIHTLIQDTQTDILLVAYGHPNQELWIARNQSKLGIPVAIGVGGTFDELVGTVKPAPEWMHRLGLKWLWRLVIQPERYKRIFTAVVLFPLAVLYRQILQRRVRRIL
jgi:N-acetylglucosaminyldiphosphoundecaprenol N-acetyl-beta-D-mannosaminyltransferase